MKRLQTILPLIFAWIAVALGASAKQDSLKTYTLPPVYVIVEKPSEAIGSLHTINSEDVINSLSLREAMQKSVGISATIGTKDESNLRLRGFRKNEIKVMVDGKPLNNGYFGNVDISKLSLLDIEEIQILKGPASPLFGTNNMGGVINIISKAPPKNYWLELNTIFKRYNTNEVNISTAHSFDTWNYRLGVSREKTNGFILSEKFTPTPYEDGGVRNNSDQCLYNIFGSLNRELLTFHNIGMDFGYSQMDKKNIPSSIYEQRYRQYQDWMRYHIGLRTKMQVNDSSTLNLQLLSDGSSDRYLEYKDPAYENLTLDSMMHNAGFGFHSRFTTTFSGNKKLDIGYNYDYQVNTRKDNDSYLSWTDSFVHIHQAFSQFECLIIPKLLFTIGIGINNRINRDNNNFQPQWEPALGIVYEIIPDSETSLAIGQNTSHPTMRQLYSASKGNPDLKPQNALKLEINHNQALWQNKISLSCSAYFNDTKDLIDLYKGRYENIHKVQSQGTEIGLSYSPANFFQTSVNYAYLSYRKNSDYYLTEIPKNSVELCQRFTLPGKINFMIYSSYRDRRLSQDDSVSYHTLNTYWKHDLLGIFPWKILELSLGVENLLDEDYQSEYGYPEPGRNFSIALKAKI
ncbi:MAG: TonB-dependent receptor [Candidatus Cloacimonas sp.]|nr:TonB-dependent receptor [Candidatus Cloacimonas sp.]